MSVVNVALSPHRAAVLTDSSLYDAKGTILGFDRKAIPVEGWNGVVTFRGNNWGLAAGIEMAERFGSFDEFIARSGPEIERWYRAACEAGILTAQRFVEITAVGWSERDDCAKAFLFFAGAAEHNHHPDYVWVPLSEVSPDNILYLDLSSRARWRLHRQGAEPDVDYTAETFDPVRHGLPLIEEQRRMPAEAWTGLGGTYCIGGELWLTIVDRDGTRQDVIHEWPDKVGRTIRPAPVDEARLPKIVPSIAEGWSFRDFDEAIRTGLLDPETFEPRQRQTRPPVDWIAAAAATGLSRHERRAAKAKTKKGYARV